MSETNKLEVGDVVLLLSGGPKMTVESVAGASVQCVWFHVSAIHVASGRPFETDVYLYDQPQRASFNVAALEKAV